jgi:hypothetical protein
MNCRRFRFRSSPEELTKERTKRSVFLPIKVHIRADIAAMISVGMPSATATTAKAKAAIMIIPLILPESSGASDKEHHACERLRPM